MHGMMLEEKCGVYELCCAGLMIIPVVCTTGALEHWSRVELAQHRTLTDTTPGRTLLRSHDQCTLASNTDSPAVLSSVRAELWTRSLTQHNNIVINHSSSSSGRHQTHARVAAVSQHQNMSTTTQSHLHLLLPSDPHSPLLTRETAHLIITATASSFFVLTGS